MNNTKHLLELFGQKRYSEIEGISKDRMLKVDGNEVTKIIKKNHSYLDCTCCSSGKTEHNSLCRHKQFFIVLPILELFKEHLNKLINEYKGFAGISAKCDSQMFLDDLNKLKRICEGKR